MKKSVGVFFLFMLSFVYSEISYCQIPIVQTGVSDSLAAFRKNGLSKIRYTLALDIPREKSADITAKETIEFKRQDKKNGALEIDFKENTSNIKSIVANGASINIDHQKEHIIISPDYLREGNNAIQIDFTAGNGALNRREDYLYTLFVPDRARTMFPCFDQPDLKAVYSLTLSIPNDWSAIANAEIKDSTNDNQKKVLRFFPSDTLSTYLFSFAAGKFKVATGTFRQKKVELLYRETDSSKIKHSLDSIFRIYDHSIEYYEQWTGIPYPFQKHGMVAIPDFQFGGMEHPGAILFQSSSLFLDSGATQSQLNGRSSLIGHEAAHIWFGDMVTMKWFSDVWMKEVFANFMADKSTGSIIKKEDFEMKFLTGHFPAAYAVDRTQGSNPIRQKLQNLQEAGMLYGPIIYDKAPIMMRQLELLMGKESFQQGVKEYLKKYAFTNASWPDLIDMLAKHTSKDLKQWNKVWVNETGRPVFDYSVEYANKIKKFSIAQHSENGNDNIWPQAFEISLYYEHSVKSFSINTSKATETIKALEGNEKPIFILFNSNGIGYGVWPIDSALTNNIDKLENPVSRASAFLSLYENMLNARYVSPESLLDFFVKRVPIEKTELNVRLLTGYISSIFWEFISTGKRKELSAKLENEIWRAMENQTLANNKKMIFQCYENIFLSENAYQILYPIWEKQKPPQEIVLTEDDYTSLSFSLALRSDSNETMLQQQLKRIKNPDRAKRFQLIMPAVSSDEKTRATFFEGLSDLKNRSNQSAVAAGLSYLNHPLRQNTSIQFLPKSLDLLSDIQRTGDVFFPNAWLQSVFGSYQSKDALKIVDDFLNAHPDYNSILRLKILQTTDNLRRSLQLVKE